MRFGQWQKCDTAEKGQWQGELASAVEYQSSTDHFTLFYFEGTKGSHTKDVKRPKNVHNRIDNRLTRILRPMKRRGTFYEFFISLRWPVWVQYLS
jgi:hypothetical protein